MSNSDFYAAEVAQVSDSASLLDAANLMRHYAVGCVVVLSDDQQPVGVITDRDLTTRVVAKGLDPDVLQAADVMSKPVITARSDEPLETVAERMRDNGVRRLPVVSQAGQLTGIVALDDVIVELGHELSDIGEALTRGLDHAQREAARHRRRSDLTESITSLREQIEDIGREAADRITREVEHVRERLGRSE